MCFVALSVRMDDLVDLCKNINLTKVEVRVCSLPTQAKLEGESRLKHSLIGRILTNKRINKQAFLKNILKFWSFARKMKIEDIGQKTYIFKFSNLEDGDKVINK